MAFKGALVRDGRCRRAAVADRKMEVLADRLAVGIGRGHRNRVAAEVAVGRHAGNDTGMGVDAQTCRQLGREGQGITGGGGREMT